MLKALVIVIAIMIAVVNVSAQGSGSGRRAFGGRHVIKRPAVVRVGPATTYLKEGLTTEEVVRALGEAAVVSERNEDGAAVSVLEFQRGGNRVLIAEFVNDKLIGSRIETR
jgi:hypothetical protein